jgi:hypothetical protein
MKGAAVTVDPGDKAGVCDENENLVDVEAW